MKKCSKIRASVTALVFSLSVAAVPATLSADIIFYQGFDYGNTAGGFPGVASNWTQSAGTNAASYNAGSLEYPGMDSTGGSVRTNSTWGSSSNTLTQTLNIDISDKTEIWVSALFHVSALPGGNVSNYVANFGITVLQNSWDSAVTRSVGKNTNINDSYSVRTGGTNTALTGGSFSDTLNETVHIVYRLAEGSAAEFWINPGSTAVVGTGQSVGSVVGSLTTIESLSINFRGYTMSFDEFIVADSYSDISPVPEPGHVAAIAGAAALLLIAVRRFSRRARC